MPQDYPPIVPFVFAPITLHRVSSHQLLLDACNSGNIDRAIFALRYGADVMSHDSFRDTPLHLATLSKNYELVELLLRHGANPNAHNSDGVLPIHNAASSGFRSLFQMLAHATTNEHFFISDISNNHVLHNACVNGNMAIIHDILHHPGAQNHISDFNINGYTPLALAVAYNHPKVVETLIDRYNADKGETTPHGTLLHHAVYHNADAVTALLISRYEFAINVVDDMGDTPLHTATRRNDCNTIAHLISHYHADINAENRRGNTPLHIAALCNYHESTTTLITLNADINRPNNRQETPLIVATNNSALQTARILLNHDANLDWQDYNGQTALMHAIDQADPSMTKTIIEKGCDVDMQNQRGETALMIAIENHAYYAAYQLIRYGANVMQYDQSHNTALSIALEQKHTPTLILLLAAGANPNVEIDASKDYAPYFQHTQAIYCYSQKEDAMEPLKTLCQHFTEGGARNISPSLFFNNLTQKTTDLPEEAKEIIHFLRDLFKGNYINVVNPKLAQSIHAVRNLYHSSHTINELLTTHEANLPTSDSESIPPLLQLPRELFLEMTTYLTGEAALKHTDRLLAHNSENGGRDISH